MEEEIQIINTNTRIEKIKNFFISKRKTIITTTLVIILLLIRLDTVFQRFYIFFIAVERVDEDDIKVFKNFF